MDLITSKSISVVIATLGGEILRKTIERLNCGSVIPNEILICIPSKYLERIAWPLSPNTKIIQTECYGQVQQRIEGLKLANGQLVMQIDDDVFVHPDCLEILVNALNRDSKWAVAPSFINSISGKSIYKLSPINNFLFRIYCLLMDGHIRYSAGKVLSSGIGLGVDFEVERSEIVKADWLAGGCILHHKNNLILKDYYPLKGKAYCEDLIHSYLLNKSGVDLFVSTKAIAEIIPNKSIFDLNIMDFFHHLKGEYCSRKYFQLLSKKSLWRMRLYYVIVSVQYTVISCRRTFKKVIFK
jgi:hypothetical protein